MVAATLRNRLENLSKDTLEEYLAVYKRLSDIKRSEAGQENFLEFVKSIWPDFIEGAHHRVFAQKLQEVAEGTINRLIVNMPPRHTKSEFASYHFPAWLVGRNPKLKIIQTTHTGELAMNFGRKMRNLIASPEYKSIFPGAALAPDSKSAGRWTTTQGGEYFAAGVGGAITGRGADLLIIDDPHSEQDALSDAAMENAYEWYTSGPRQRLQPGGSIVIVMTRWSERDLTAKVLKQQAFDPKADQWEVIEFPAIMGEDQSPLAGILEARRIVGCESLTKRSKMERAMAATAHCRYRQYHKTHVVANLGKRPNSWARVYHPKLRYGLSQKRVQRLLGDYDVGGISPARGQRPKSNSS